MASINSVTLIGHLGGDPRVNATQTGKCVVNLSVATSFRVKDASGQYVDRTTWHDVVVWDKAAEFARDYLHKGSCVVVEGRIDKREYQDKEGNKRVSCEVVANRVQCLDKREKVTDAERDAHSFPDEPSDRPANGYSQTPAGNVREAFEMDSEVPF